MKLEDTTMTDEQMEDLTRAIREAFGVTSTDSTPRFLEAIATSLGHGRFVSTSIPDALIEASLNIESGLSAVANAIEKLKP